MRTHSLQNHKNVEIESNMKVFFFFSLYAFIVQKQNAKEQRLDPPILVVLL